MDCGAKRKSILLLVIVSVCNFRAIASEEIILPNDQAMQFVKAVQKRYYLVHRLEKPIIFLVDLYQSVTRSTLFDSWFHLKSPHHKKLIVPEGVSKQFKHPLVFKYMRALEKDHDACVINALWSDFLSYKYIEDELFVRETIIAIMIIYKALVLSLNPIEQKEAMFFLGAHESRGGKAPRAGGEVYENFNSILNLLDESFDKENFVITNNLRHYHIQRLQKSITILTKVNVQYLSPLWDCLTQTIHKNSISFQHEAIQECLDSILQTHSLEPLFALWRHFTAYKFANDSLFLQEFVALEYMLYRKLIDCLRIVSLKTTPTAEDLIELYASIATLPIPEMLNSLDSLVEELMEIVQKYELDASISWTQWFEKYWWVPPVIISSVIINFLLNHRKSIETLSPLS